MNLSITYRINVDGNVWFTSSSWADWTDYSKLHSLELPFNGIFIPSLGSRMKPSQDTLLNLIDILDNVLYLGKNDFVYIVGKFKWLMFLDFNIQ